jgi:diadenylate cyclase
MRMPKNLGWKLGSLLAAVLLWLAVSATPDVVTNHTAPVLYRNLSPDLMVTGDSPETIRIELRGSARELTSAALANTAAILDLRDVRSPGERTFTISDTDLGLPPGVTFLRAAPAQFRLHFARLAAKEVPVEIRFSGSLPAGYKLKGQEVAPGRLRIAGAEERVAAITSVQTDRIDLSAAAATGEFNVDAFVPDPQVHFEASPRVTVRLQIERN